MKTPCLRMAGGISRLKAASQRPGKKLWHLFPPPFAVQSEEHPKVVSSNSPGGRVGRPPRYVSVAMIRGLHRQGYSFRTIARWTGVGYGTVRRAFHGLAPDGADTVTDSTLLVGSMPAGHSPLYGFSRSASAAD